MDLLLNELLEVLSEESQLHQGLLELLVEECSSIGKTSGAQLLQLHGQKLRITKKIRAVEEVRIQKVKQLAEEWKQSWEELSLKVIISKAPERIAESLQMQYDELSRLLIEIRQQAERNSSLSEARLKPIEGSLRFLTSIQEKATYSDSGELKGRQTKLQRKSI